MEPGTKAPADDRSTGGSSWSSSAPRSDAPASDSAALHAELERLRQRESQIMSLIGCKNPEKLLHDLRNVLNELQLLRMLAETDQS